MNTGQKKRICNSVKNWKIGYNLNGQKEALILRISIREKQ